MASHLFNYFKQQNAAGNIDLDTAGDTIHVILCMTNTTADTENDGISFVGDLTTLDEFDGANYSRKTLGSQVVNLDDPNDRAEFDGANITWTALGVGTRDVAGALIFKFVTNDAASPVIAWVEFSATPDGSDFTIQWNAEGILQFS